MKNILKIWLASRFLRGGNRRQGCGCVGVIAFIIIVALILGVLGLIPWDV